MGVDYHGLRLLQFAHRHGAFGRVATLGRQAVQISEGSLNRALGTTGEGYPFGAFCEPLLRERFGASVVHPFDHSDFEGATHIHDFNQPLPIAGEAMPTPYDTVIDLGTLEHIFNLPQGLRNTWALCTVGGQILHLLPSNNYSGHGFWQFSPELFHSLYSEANGFRETSIFVAKLRDHENWYAPRFEAGKRLEYVSTDREYVLVRTVKVAEVGQISVQQSDYMTLWGEAERDRDASVQIDYGIHRRYNPSQRSGARRMIGAMKAIAERSPAAGRVARDVKALLNIRLHGMHRCFARVRIEQVVGATSP